MTNKRIIDVDTTDRADGKVPVWDTASSTHVYVSASGSVAADTIWDAPGDLAVGSGANTAAKLSIGATNGMALRRVSGAVAWDLPPGHEFDYAEKTTDTSITATTAPANTIVTANAVAYNGSTIIIIEARIDFSLPAVSAASMFIDLYDDTGGGAALATTFGLLSNPGTLSASVAGMRIATTVTTRITPSSATHTYSLRARVTSGTGTAKAGNGSSGAVVPTFLRQIKA